MPQRPAGTFIRPDSGAKPRKLPRWLGLWLTPLPPISALLMSAVVHAGASGALIAFGYNVDMPEAEPEPAAITVEIIPDARPRDETPTEIPKGDPEPTPAEETVATPENITAPPEPVKEIAALPTELALPESVPMPIQRPKPQKQKTEKPSEKPKKAEPRGIERKSAPDITLSDEATEIRTSQTSAQYASLGSQTRNVKAEQRWLGQLAAHLERRKRYPHAAQSRRLEGVVRVRFLVLSDGSVTATELVEPSGVSELDEEVLNLLQRASPVPKPPADVNPLITVPVNFSIKR